MVSGHIANPHAGPACEDQVRKRPIPRQDVSHAILQARTFREVPAHEIADGVERRRGREVIQPLDGLGSLERYPLQLAHHAQDHRRRDVFRILWAQHPVLPLSHDSPDNRQHLSGQQRLQLGAARLFRIGGDERPQRFVVGRPKLVDVAFAHPIRRRRRCTHASVTTRNHTSYWHSPITQTFTRPPRRIRMEDQ